jgi:hypothetical protein
MNDYGYVIGWATSTIVLLVSEVDPIVRTG